MGAMTHADLDIRSVTLDDAGELLTLRRAAFVTEAQQYGDPHIPPLTQTLEELQAVCDTWDSNKSDLDAALLFNRKLWTVFLSSVMSAESPLPQEIRQNVANLGTFIMSQTVALATNPRREVVASLININRELAAGLRGRG